MTELLGAPVGRFCAREISLTLEERPEIEGGLPISELIRAPVGRLGTGEVARFLERWPRGAGRSRRPLAVGRLTTPDQTALGLQMFALCDKKQTSQESPLKSQVREEIYAKRFEAQAKQYMDEIRKQAMIEYKNR